MTRAAAKLLLSAAILGGMCLAFSGALNAGTDNLPTAPTVAAPATTSAPADAEGKLVVDLKDWQKTRLKAKTSNIIP